MVQAARYNGGIGAISNSCGNSGVLNGHDIKFSDKGFNSLHEYNMNELPLIKRDARAIRDLALERSEISKELTLMKNLPRIGSYNNKLEEGLRVDEQLNERFEEFFEKIDNDIFGLEQIRDKCSSPDEILKINHEIGNLLTTEIGCLSKASVQGRLENKMQVLTNELHDLRRKCSDNSKPPDEINKLKSEYSNKLNEFNTTKAEFDKVSNKVAQCETKIELLHNLSKKEELQNKKQSLRNEMDGLKLKLHELHEKKDNESVPFQGRQEAWEAHTKLVHEYNSKVNDHRAINLELGNIDSKIAQHEAKLESLSNFQSNNAAQQKMKHP